MRNSTFLEKKKIARDRTTSYHLDNLHVDFRFKFFDFYNEVIYLKKRGKFDKIFINIDKSSLLHSKNLNKTLSILLTNDNEISEINKKFRSINKPTNVLSFPSKHNYHKLFPKSTREFHLGDIILSMETILEEAKIEKKSFNDHFIHILTHGILHIFGYDHQNVIQRKKMEDKEIKILNNLGIKNPYG